MIKREDALRIIADLRKSAESKHGSHLERTDKEAAARARTDLNEAVGSGFVPYAEDKAGYPEWSLFAFAEKLPELIASENKSTRRTAYGMRADYKIPRKYEALYALSDLRAVLRGVRKTTSGPEMISAPVFAAFNAIDASRPSFAKIHDAMEDAMRDAKRRLSVPADAESWRTQIREATNVIGTLLLVIEENEARRLHVHDVRELTNSPK